MKKSFTMVELIFVIVIIGILSAVAIPKLFATRDDAQITKIRTDVSTIRSAISNLRTTNLMKGNGSYPEALDDADANTENEELFDGNESIGTLLDYPLYSENKNGHWMKTDDTNYTVKLMDNDIKFNYYNTNGHFDCKGLNSDEADDLCKKLTR
jgi:general secretion pathway protein G